MSFNSAGAASGAVSGGMSGFELGGPWGALGGALGGGLFGGFTGSSDNSADIDASAAANAANFNFARENRDWQERMSNTAHQREVKDLLAAGLNPMLSMGHPGASSPSPNSAQAQNTRLGVSERNIQRSQLMSQLGVNSASIAKLSADAALSRESVLTQRSQQQLNNAHVSNLTGDYVNVFGTKIPKSWLQQQYSSASGAAGAVKNFLARGHFGDSGGVTRKNALKEFFVKTGDRAYVNRIKKKIFNV